MQFTTGTLTACSGGEHLSILVTLLVSTGWLMYEERVAASAEDVENF